MLNLHDGEIQQEKQNGCKDEIISRASPVLTIRSGNDASIWIVLLRTLLKIKNPGMIVYDLQFQEPG